MFAVFKDHGRFRRGQIIDQSTYTMNAWWPKESWREFCVRLVGFDGRADDDEIRRYVASVADADDGSAPAPAAQRAGRKGSKAA